MGADIKKLRGRIKSVDSTLHLTKAMGLVASSKIRGATLKMNSSKSYLDAICQAVEMLVTSFECEKSPYMQKRETNKTLMIIVAGDRGLAGGYNANVFRMAKEIHPDCIIPIGKRSCDRYKGELRLAEKFSVEDAFNLSKDICERFSKGEFDRVGILCTKYVSIMSQEAQIKWILPLERKETKEKHSILFEPDELTILNSSVFEYVAAQIVASVRESYASEVAARRFAMDSAGKNAQQMLDDLCIKYNRARQGAITQEITEIVAGSDL